eukprot:TRINITY_DN1940_c0_g1_i3.p2 TRINITY_DN1940_c0_g1~~TRINITY_DN1940_c0_g1_i3.p2  ORF type:complete len:118 (-),score=40.37 TRINITY_DN1940_c0_g1_i3:12-365(-)
MLGATSATQCVCKCGFGYSGGLCTACAVGSYKETVGNTACIKCSTNGITWATTATNSSCTRLDCYCKAGYYGNHTDCAKCKYGTYKPTDGNGVCLNCTANASTDVIGATNWTPRTLR